MIAVQVRKIPAVPDSSATSPSSGGDARRSAVPAPASRRAEARADGEVEDKQCEATGCREPVASWQVMCRHHWRLVPFWLRKQINQRRAARKWVALRRSIGSAVRMVEEMEYAAQRRRAG